MKKYKRSSNSVFLMELLLNILLFSALLIIVLQFFIKAHTLTQSTTELHYAVTLCSNIASIYASQESTGADLEISKYYPYCTNMKDQIFIYFNRDFEECKKDCAAYYLLVSPNHRTDFSSLSSAKITLYTNTERKIYSMTAYHYQPLTPSLKEVDIS